MLFFGSDQFSIICLKAILQRQDSLIRNLSIVTPPDNLKAGKSSQQQVPLKVFCRDAGIPTFDAPPKTLKDWQIPKLSSGELYDLGVVVSFGYLLPKNIIRGFDLGAVNVHPSLLPKYRGASPIQYTIINGDSITGVSIIELSIQTFDAGRIFNQTTIDVPKNVYFDHLRDTLAEVGALDLVKTLERFDHYKKNLRAQDDSLVTYAPKIPKSMTFVKWSQQSKNQIYALHRAIGSKTPLATQFRGRLCHLIDIEPPLDPQDEDLIDPLKSFAQVSPGTLVFIKSKNLVYVRCIDGWIGLRAIHVHGKRTQPADSFNNGYQIVNGIDQFDSLE